MIIFQNIELEVTAANEDIDEITEIITNLADKAKKKLKKLGITINVSHNY